MPSRYPVYEYDEDDEPLNPATVDPILQPMLACAIGALPNRTRLVAEPNRLVLEMVSPTGEATILYGIPPHVRERVLDCLRWVARYCGEPFNVSRQGKIYALYNGRPFDITVDYEVRFFGRDEILNFVIVESKMDDPVE